MKILVAVKRVIDPYVKIRVKPDNTGVETQNIKMALNPFDEIALEEALRWREKYGVAEIVVVSVGTEASIETLRHALAFGADRAILIKTDRHLDPLNIATILKEMVMQEQPDLVLMGKQSIDGDNNQTPQMLAGLLDWPQATYASATTLEDNVVEVKREIDGGLETLRLSLPAVISTDLRLNDPRYVTLPNIMKAKAKPLQTIPLDELQLNLIPPQFEVLKVSSPQIKQRGKMLASVVELVDKLKHEAKVL